MRSSEPLTADAAELRLRVQLPPGYHLTKGANSGWQASLVGAGSGAGAAAAVQVSPGKGPLQESGGGVASAVLKVQRPPGGAGAGALPQAGRVLARGDICQEADAWRVEEVVFEVPLAPAGAGGGAGRQIVELGYSASAAAPQVSLPGL